MTEYPHNNYPLTITMTGRPPVRIFNLDWPVIAHVKMADESGWCVVRASVKDPTQRITSAVNVVAGLRSGYMGTVPYKACVMADLPTTLAERIFAKLPAETNPDDGMVHVRIPKVEYEDLRDDLADLGGWTELLDSWPNFNAAA